MLQPAAAAIIRSAGASVLLLCLAAGLAAAQERPAVPDTLRGDRLLQMPDPAEPPADTLPVVKRRSMPARPDAERDTLPVDTAAADTTAPSIAADPAADSIMGVLRQLPGYTVTEYQGRDAMYEADRGVLRLRGQAQVTREGDRLEADSIVYRERRDLVEAYGSPRVTGQETELAGDTLYYDLAMRRATALGARTTITENATWFVRGDISVEDQGDTQRLYARAGHFTTCDLEIPHYHFESDRIMVVRDKLLVARPARLYFGKVPVLVLPFIVQNLESGRRSGLLVPRFGINDIIRTSGSGTERGTGREISDLGFYWAINDYMGAQVAGTWRSGAYTSLRGTLDYRWRRQFLDGNLTWEQFWEQEGTQEMRVFGTTGWQPDERTQLNLQANYTTSSRFLRDISYDPTLVTQEMSSSISANRRFDWGNVDVGADRRQSVSDGSVSQTLPSIGISPNSLTLFRAPPTTASWWNNVTLSPGQIRYSRSSSDRPARESVPDADPPVPFAPGQGQDQTRISFSPSLQMGNLSVRGSASWNSIFQEIIGSDSIASEDTDEGDWTATMSYRQSLVGSTSISPTLSLSQRLRREEQSAGELLAAPTRLRFGADLNTDVYGFFPGFGPFSTIRHRFSPRFDYGFEPAVEHTALQDTVFGRASGAERNTLTVSFNQTWEAKLRDPGDAVEDEPADTLAAETVLEGDTALVETDRPAGAAPAEPQKVTILSVTTSAVEYDFARPDSLGSKFRTREVRNTINSDYFRGLSLQMAHELFDATEAEENELGEFSPRLSSLSTSFQLGPDSWIVRMLGLGPTNPQRERVGSPEDAQPGPQRDSGDNPPGTGSFTGNPRSIGGGPWRIGIGYNFTRGARRSVSDSDFGRQPGPGFGGEATQTLRLDMQFPLTPNWGMSWNTQYSITDSEFADHSLRFTRDLHRWQANFDYMLGANGNSSFRFYVELIDNRDIKFEHRERNLGIDRRRR